MTRLQLIVPPMRGDVVQQQVAEVAEALYQHTDELAPMIACTIAQDVKLYQPVAPVGSPFFGPDFDRCRPLALRSRDIVN